MGWSYPPEVHEFVSKWCTQLRDPDLVEICNECFGTEFTVSKMRTFRANHGYKNGLGKLSSAEYWRGRRDGRMGFWSLYRKTRGELSRRIWPG